MQKFVIGFHYSLVTQMADRSQTSTGLPVYVYGGLHKMLTHYYQQLFCWQKPIL